MSTAPDPLVELAQGGRLLDRRALESLPEVSAAKFGFADHLRDALTHIPTDGAAHGDPLSTLLDVVLEDGCGLHVGWLKGLAVGAAHAEKLIDGTSLKPRRVRLVDGHVELVVFTTSAERVGLHTGRRPMAQAVEYLRKRRIPLGIVTNGQDWRLVYADQDGLAWLQWSADQWLAADGLHPRFDLLRRILSSSTLSPGESGADSPLLVAIRTTRRGQARLSAELGERVRTAVELLLRSRRPVLDPVWATLDARATYVAASHFVMRLVVVLFAEARELLPVDSPVYHHAYGLRGLMESLERSGPERRRSRSSAWPRVLALFRLLHDGSPHPELLVPTYGGALFRAGDLAGDGTQQALHGLESPADPPDDDVVYHLLVLLTRTTERVREGAGWRIVAAPVDFTELTSEYIGILYEGLLDYELHRAGAEPIVFLGLGDEPALPLDRLEAMDDKQLAALVEKAKVKRAVAAAEDDYEEEGKEEPEEDDAEAEEQNEGPAAAALATADLLPVDDDRAKARDRALRWAERAAIVGKLVRTPRGRTGRENPAWRAQVQTAANQLIVDLKLPGELYLVRWGGTRKGAGTFYTRPQLTLPTVRRTLEPLLSQEDGTLRKPEELLALKVCDPAMGSGSFLVAAVRVLTDAVVTSLHSHGRVLPNGDRVRLDCELLPEGDRDQPQERVEAIVRRAVVEQCVYGVDLDPLAVELARVALWVETLDRRLPFTFLDHKLRCGDALVGSWLDRFRDYPLLAWGRQSPDEKWRGVTHAADTWADALKAKRKAMIDEQVDLLTGQKSWLGANVSDDELRVAIERVRELYRRLRKIPASQPDKRAEIWRTQVAPDPALAKVREAFDTWCALWFWPLDRLDEAPGPAALPAPGAAAREIVRELRDRLRFFHWELEFPDVFTEKGAGFDAVVANPPWEVRKPSSKEFFSDRDPLYRSYGKQDALAYQRAQFSEDAAFEERWLAHVGAFKDAGNFVRNAGEPFGDAENAQGKQLVGLASKNVDESKRLHRRWASERARKTGLSDPAHPFRNQGSADLNSYKLFVEQAHALLRPGGQFGLLTPSGLYTDKGSVDLRKLLLERCSWRWLYGFENRAKIFDIDSRFKFAVSIAQKGGRTEAVRAAFMRHDLGDWADAKGTLSYPSERIHAFSPKSLSVLEIPSDRDLEVLTKIYSNSVLLGEQGPHGWGIRYTTEFHMTNDSKLFIPRDAAEEAGYRPDQYGRWIRADTDVLLPVYEGRMIGQFDFSKKGWVSGKGRAAVWRDIPWEKKVVEPQFLVRVADYLKAIGRDGNGNALRCLRLGFMDVGSATNSRTMIAALTYDVPHGNKVPVLATADHGVERSAQALCGILGTYAFDFAMRARLGGLTLNYFIIEETPLPRLTNSGGRSISAAAFGLGAAHERFSPAWLAMRNDLPAQRPWRSWWAVTPHERLRLRCIVDAVAAAEYGLSRDDLRWILRNCDLPRERLADPAFRRSLDPKGFWRIDKHLDPELRHPVLSLVAFDLLNRLIADHGGERDCGIDAFAALNGGEGWMLPDTVRLFDYGLGHDDRARQPQPVASRLGPRFLQWQLAQDVEESWAECEQHALVVCGAPHEVVQRTSDSMVSAQPIGGRAGQAQLAMFERKEGK